MLQAACLVFWRACEERGLEHCLNRNFTLSYDTTIPRQAGLSGSSAIVCAALNCLLEFYGVGDRCAPRQPSTRASQPSQGGPGSVPMHCQLNSYKSC